MSAPILIERPPRIQPDLPQEVVELPAPPNDTEAKSRPLVQLFLPMIMIVGYIAIAVVRSRSGGGGIGRLLFMVPMALSMFASVGYAIYSRQQDKKNEGRAQAAYQELLVEKREVMKNKHDIQRRFYRHTYPGIKERYYITKYANARATDPRSVQNDSVDSETAMRLWERRSTDRDFGEVRVGMGTRPSTFIYTPGQGQGDFESPLMRDALRLANDSQVLTNVPITIRLRPSDPKARAEGGGNAKFAIGITGNDVNGIYAFIHAFIWNYTTFHAPTEAKVIVLGAEERQTKWHWVTALPHNGGTCFETVADREKERDNNSLIQFTKKLRSSYEERERRLLDAEYKGDVSLPLNLVIVDLLDKPEGSQLHTIDSDAAISLLMRKGGQVGGAVIFLVPHAHDVPSGCQSVMELTQPPRTESGNRPMQFRYAEVGINTPRYTGAADRIYKPQALQDFANFLNPLSIPQSYGGGIPKGVLMFDMLRIGDANDLREQLRENWSRSMLPPTKQKDSSGKSVSYEKDYSGWIQNTLGMTSDGGYRTLRYSADADGVHGLIAGSTGSGKSELLMTMILDMAFKYDPSIINFVLVDFKGGGAFKPLYNDKLKLPHIVDVVTNLGTSAVERMFAAITSELNRRQAINTDTDSKHIVEYRRNKLHLPDANGQFGQTVMVGDEKQVTAPYPHLFIIIDEFAEMIAANPEYKAQLNSITRLGRALGVTLVLAAQRPTGVTDQMRANIKFRIALRVETREESNEILRQPDAAYLPNGVPGRGYLQVGNENIEMIQVAWSGSDYEGAQLKVEETEQLVIWPDRRKRETNAKEKENEGKKIFTLMVETMESVSDEMSLKQRKPWPDFLPISMTLQHQVDLYEDYWTSEGYNTLVPPEFDIQATHAPINWAINRWMTDKTGWDRLEWGEEGDAMQAVIGLTDDPYNAQQHPLVINFQRGHAVVFGASGWGKTTFLRTLVASLTATHTPNDLHIHVLDFGGQQLSTLEEFPHVGSVIIPDEDERVRRSLVEMDRILQERKSQFSDAKVGGLYTFNERYPDQKLPAILFIIDNFAAFRESFEELLPDLTALVRESRAAGIHFVVSAELPNLLSGKLYSLFSERVALKLSDASEYTGIVGRGAREIEDIPGRGYVRLDRRAAMCQVAMAVGDITAQPFDEIDNISILVRHMNEWMEKNSDKINQEMRPEPIRVLDPRVRLSDLLDGAEKPARGVAPIIGMDGRTLEPWMLDIAKQGPHFEILGPAGSGKTTILRTVALSLASTYTPEEVMIVLIDTRRRLFTYKGQRTLDELPHVVEAISEVKDLGDLPLKLKAEIDNPERGEKPIFILIDNYDSFSEDVEGLKLPDKRRPLDELARLARERGQDGLHFILAMSMRARNDALRKQTRSCRFGLGLKEAEAAANLEGKVPRYLRGVELPDGRGFVVKSGRTHRVQVATPYQERGDDNIENDLDSWITKIVTPSNHSKNEWVYQPEAATGDADADGESDDDTANKNGAKPAASKKSIRPLAKKADPRAEFIKGKVGKIDIDKLKQQMSEKSFLPASFYDHHTPEQLINEAIERGVVEAPDAIKEA